MKRKSAGRWQSSLESYLAELERFPLLPPEEEQRLARAYRATRDRRFAHRLVAANLRFVVKVARQYGSYRVALVDLVQEGNLGLMAAVERFDPERGVRLVSYAAFWIRAAIQDCILRSWSLVKIGTTEAQRKLFFSLARVQRELERADLERGLASPRGDSARVAERLAVTQGEVEQMVSRLSSRDISLDAPLDEGDGSFHDVLPDHGVRQDEELSTAQEQAHLRVRVGEALSRLLERERHIIEQHVMSEPPVSLSELGVQLEISAARSGQLERRARKKLERALEGLVVGREGHDHAAAAGRSRRDRPPPSRRERAA
jgi:RNA polymerase sigma-32 factor